LTTRKSFKDALKLSFGYDALCFANMVGGFAFTWKLINNILMFKIGSNKKRSSAFAGAIGSIKTKKLPFLFFANHHKIEKLLANSFS
jgi:hypothetical protein